MKLGTPVPLDDGTWGARIDSDEAPEVGESITVTSRSGTWNATIIAIDYAYQGIWLVRLRR